MAPEILRGGAPNARADVFTLGVLADQLLTGRLPFKAPSLPELMGQMLQAKAAAPTTFVSALPVSVSDAIVRAIDGMPANRFESADTFANSLR